MITVLTHSPHLLLLHLLLLRSIKRRNGLDIFLRDCVCLQYCKGSVVALSEDHKPDNREEEKRINTANHFVSESRVDGNLALSRAIGDFQYKDMPNLAA